MARVELALSALEDLARLKASHSLPADTGERVRRSLRPLERFPRLGVELGGAWEGLRFVLGPWRWLLVVYAYVEDEDRVVIVTFQDGRSSSAATRARTLRP